MSTAVDPTVPPSGMGCVECDAVGGWWVHLRRCAACGHIGCCDDSLARHASAHWRETGHPIIRSFEPGEDWFWNPSRIPSSSLCQGRVTECRRTGPDNCVTATERSWPTTAAKAH
jgi:hypothetical protein